MSFCIMYPIFHPTGFVVVSNNTYYILRHKVLQPAYILYLCRIVLGRYTLHITFLVSLVYIHTYIVLTSVKTLFHSTNTSATSTLQDLC